MEITKFQLIEGIISYFKYNYFKDKMNFIKLFIITLL